MQGLKHLYLILISTFVVGFIGGVYVYILVREPAPLPEHENTAAQFEVIADEYGGCEFAGCGSYRVSEDGGYTFIERGRGEADVRREGTLPETEFDDLRELVEESGLARLRETSSSEVCPAAFDGISYRFDITVGGTAYAFDTCTHEITSTALFDRLIRYFDLFRTDNEADAA